MTRVAWVTPGYPPDRGGVSDHSFGMVSALREQGHEVLVCSKPHERGFRHLNTELRAYRPEALIVAYVPLGYSPHTGGIAPVFTLWCAQLRRQFDSALLLLAHEVCLPIADHLRRLQLKLALLGIAQAAQFEALARAFDCVTFSHEGSRAIWAKRMPHAHLTTTRICSSIPLAHSADPAGELASSGYSVPAKTVLFFGSGHDSVSFDYIEAAFGELLKVEPEARLVVIGMDAAKLRRVRPTLADLGSRIQTLGFVPAREVSLWFQVAELVLLPFVDGVNARKTTVMATFQHGRALATTTGINTKGDIPWPRLCAVAPLDRAAFAGLAVRCFQDARWRAELGAAARADYEANASPSVTAARLLECALDAGGSR